MPRQDNIFQSHGDGRFNLNNFRGIGENVIFEAGVLVFHSENITLGNNIYIGHYTILKGYNKSEMVISDNTWIGQGCFFHSAGGIDIGQNVGIGPHVKIITSFHKEEGINVPILYSEILKAPVVIEKDCDIGVGAIILPGVHIGCGCQIGAGAVVTRNIKPYCVIAGVPARVLRKRTDTANHSIL